MKIWAIVILFLIKMVHSHLDDKRDESNLNVNYAEVDSSVPIVKKFTSLKNVFKNKVTKRLETALKNASEIETNLYKYIIRSFKDSVKVERIIDVFPKLVHYVDRDQKGDLSAVELKEFQAVILRECLVSSSEAYFLPGLAEMLLVDGHGAYMMNIQKILREIDANNNYRYTSDEINTYENSIILNRELSRSIKEFYYHLLPLLFGPRQYRHKHNMYSEKRERLCLNIF